MKTLNTLLSLTLFTASLSFGQNNILPTTGNVGIGTTTPSANLEVAGSAKISAWSPVLTLQRDTNTGGYIQGIQTKKLDGTDNWFFGNVGLGTNPWVVSLGNFEDPKMTVLNNGNVGIGTGTPIAKLQVTGNIITGNADGQEGSLSLGNISHGLKRTNNNVELHTNGGDGNLLFTTLLNQEKMRVTASGYVGIGTSNPQEKLEVVDGNIGAQWASNEGPALSLLNPSKTASGAIWRMYNMTGPYQNSLQFWSYASNFSDGRANFVLSDNGNVGIGTQSPSAKLEVYKDLSTSTLKISNNDPSSFNTELRLGGMGGSGGFEKSAIISSPNPSGWYRQDLYFCLANGNNTASAAISDAAMVVKSYVSSGKFGYVGIGTANPDEKLTVKGKIHSEEIIVDLNVPADYVFQKYYTGKSELKSDYVMPTLAEIESFTKKNNHLPNIPSAKEMQAKGMSLGEMNNLLLQKVEELTLYAIEQEKKSEQQHKDVEELKALVNALMTKKQ